MKKINYKMILHFTIFYIILTIFLFISIIINKNIIIGNKTQIIKNMDESTEVTNLNNTINTLQASHLEYSTKIQTHKTNLAKAITNAGVTTSGDATFETMIDNVSKIVSTKTGDATATATQILSGKTAYVKGSKVTGTMTNRGAWTSKPTSSEKVTIPAGYHNGSGYVDTSNVYNDGYSDAQTQLSNTTQRTLVFSGSYYFNNSWYSLSHTLSYDSTNKVWTCNVGTFSYTTENNIITSWRTYGNTYYAPTGTWYDFDIQWTYTNGTWAGNCGNSAVSSDMINVALQV